MKWPFVLRSTHDREVKALRREAASWESAAGFNKMYWDQYKERYEALQRDYTKKAQELARYKKASAPANEER